MMVSNDRRRLSEARIWEGYPDQWLGLTDVKRNESRDRDIDSAVVSYSNLTKSSALCLMADTRKTGRPVQAYATIGFDGDYAEIIAH